MRAAVLHTHGQPPSHGDHPDPVAGEGRSIVQVTAAPIVPLDLLCASGTSYFGPPAVPYVPGVQGVGVVKESSALAPGTRVFFSTSAGMTAGDGSLAEWAAVPDEDLVVIDVPVLDAAVAAIGLSGVAAWMMLTWRARMQAGERVLVLGGGGAVGQVAIGAAKVLGASQVVAAARSEASRKRALESGADEVVELGGDVDELTARFGDPTYDVVIDSVFGAAATAATRVLAPGGRLVNLGGSAADEAVFSSAVLRSKMLSVLGYTNNALTPEQRAGALTAVLQHAASGEIGVAHETVPLAGIGDAWQRQAAGETNGRLVVTFS
ncbi:zinc-binding alcohol dehydrogenase family protein [Kribbella sp. NPDC048915]|uniref:quinone oxidoreductase family protein n=1 Tax=Kribbella sp. NPDC048915 TaxID=3155148 RepID=UPI0033F5CC63